jgi:hypothetical protein
MRYDVLISYNSQDHAVVGEIAKRLHERGIKAFLDRWYLAKGQPWRSLLEENIAQAQRRPLIGAISRATLNSKDYAAPGESRHAPSARIDGFLENFDE